MAESQCAHGRLQGTARETPRPTRLAVDAGTPARVRLLIGGEDSPHAGGFDPVLEGRLPVPYQAIGGGIEVRHQLLIGQLLFDFFRRPAVGVGEVLVGGKEPFVGGAGIGLSSIPMATKGFAARHTPRTASSSSSS